MASIDDYTNGKVLQEAGQALSLLKASDDSLAGTETGELHISGNLHLLEHGKTRFDMH